MGAVSQYNKSSTNENLNTAPERVHGENYWLPNHSNGRIAKTMQDRKASNEVSKSPKKAKILLDATRDFVQISRPTQVDIEKYKEFFYEFVSSTEVSDRRIISATLARSSFVPRSIAIYMAQDRLEIAAPFLLFSPVLDIQDLSTIVMKKGTEYCDVIKRREDIDTNDLSLNKPESTSSHANLDNKHPILGTPEAKPHNEQLSGEEIVALASIGGRLGKQKKTNTKLDSNASNSNPGELELDDNLPFELGLDETRHLMFLARTQNYVAFADLINSLCGLESDATLRLLKASSGDELVYLIKALDISAPHNLQIMLLFMPRIGRSIDEFRRVKELLSELDVGICRMIFNEIGANFEKTNNFQQSDTKGFHQAVKERREGLMQLHSYAEQKLKEPISQKLSA